MRCPFNTETYAAGLTQLGVARMHPVRRLPIFTRPIGTTGFTDGVGPWPYLWVDDSDITALEDEFGDLVTVTIVTQPGFTPGPRGNPTLLKHHYVYDPSLPAPALSRRARQRVRDSEKTGTFSVVTDTAGRLAIGELYEGLKRRRTMAGIFLDMRASHFEAVARLDGGVFFRVDSDTGIGAMACGVLRPLQQSATRSGGQRLRRARHRSGRRLARSAELPLPVEHPVGRRSPRNLRRTIS